MTKLLIIAVDDIETAKKLRTTIRAVHPGAAEWTAIDSLIAADVISGRLPPEGVADHEIPPRPGLSAVLTKILGGDGDQS